MSKVPSMVNNNLIVTESTAIQHYIARKSDTALYPKDIVEQAHVDRWLNLVAHEVRTPILDIEVYSWVAQSVGNPVNEGVVKVCNFRLERALPVLNERLATRKYLHGDTLTIADISLVSALDPVDVIGFDISLYPHLRAFLENGRTQPWYLAVNAHFGIEFGL